MKYCLICKFKGVYDKKDARHFLENLKLCRKHHKELEENQMMECPTCHNQDLEFKQGTAKTTGKPWKAYHCAPCNIMIGMNGVPWGMKKSFSGPKNAPNSQIKASGEPSLSSNPVIEAKLNEIISILHREFPDSSTPF